MNTSMTSTYTSKSRRHHTLEDYILENKVLGEGGYGRVELCTCKHDMKKYAMKIILKNHIVRAKILDVVKREINIQKKLRHPHCLRLITYFEDKKNVFLILEFAPNGSLFKYIKGKKKLEEREAFIFFFQSCLGLDYLHQNNIIHRDLKPENLLLDAKGNIKISDFGWSAFMDKKKRMTFCGTLDYLPPEMILETPHDHKVDLWSMGVLLYEMLHGYPPFEGNTIKTKTESIMSGKRKPYKPGLDPGCINLIDQLLTIDVKARITMDGIFAHPFIVAWAQNLSIDIAKYRQYSKKKRRLRGTGGAQTSRSIPSNSHVADPLNRSMDVGNSNRLGSSSLIQKSSSTRQLKLNTHTPTRQGNVLTQSAVLDGDGEARRNKSRTRSRRRVEPENPNDLSGFSDHNLDKMMKESGLASDLEFYSNITDAMETSRSRSRNRARERARARRAGRSKSRNGDDGNRTPKRGASPKINFYKQRGTSQSKTPEPPAQQPQNNLQTSQASFRNQPAVQSNVHNSHAKQNQPSLHNSYAKQHQPSLQSNRALHNSNLSNQPNPLNGSQVSVTESVSVDPKTGLKTVTRVTRKSNTPLSPRPHQSNQSHQQQYQNSLQTQPPGRSKSPSHVPGRTRGRNIFAEANNLPAPPQLNPRQVQKRQIGGTVMDSSCVPQESLHFVNRVKNSPVFDPKGRAKSRSVSPLNNHPTTANTTRTDKTDRTDKSPRRQMKVQALGANPRDKSLDLDLEVDSRSPSASPIPDKRKRDIFRDTAEQKPRFGNKLAKKQAQAPLQGQIDNTLSFGPNARMIVRNSRDQGLDKYRNARQRSKSREDEGRKNGLEPLAEDYREHELDSHEFTREKRRVDNSRREQEEEERRRRDREAKEREEEERRLREEEERREREKARRKEEKRRRRRKEEEERERRRKREENSDSEERTRAKQKRRRREEPDFEDESRGWGDSEYGRPKRGEKHRRRDWEEEESEYGERERRRERKGKKRRRRVREESRERRQKERKSILTDKEFNDMFTSSKRGKRDKQRRRKDSDLLDTFGNRNKRNDWNSEDESQYPSDADKSGFQEAEGARDELKQRNRKIERMLREIDTIEGDRRSRNGEGRRKKKRKKRLTDVPAPVQKQVKIRKDDREAKVGRV